MPATASTEADSTAAAFGRCRLKAKARTNWNSKNAGVKSTAPGSARPDCDAPIASAALPASTPAAASTHRPSMTVSKNRSGSRRAASPFDAAGNLNRCVMASVPCSVPSIQATASQNTYTP